VVLAAGTTWDEMRDHGFAHRLYGLFGFRGLGSRWRQENAPLVVDRELAARPSKIEGHAGD